MKKPVNHFYDLQLVFIFTIVSTIAMVVFNNVTDRDISVNEDRGLHDMYFHKMFSFYGPVLDKQVARIKEQILHRDLVMGDVLEIGAGHGSNFKYIVDRQQIFSWVALEPNSLMHPKLIENAKSNYFEPGKNFTLSNATIQEADFEEGSFDTIISTFTLCELSDQDVVAAIERLYKWLKPQGTLVFIEHQSRDKGSSMRTLQSTIEPFFRFFTGSCHITTDVLGGLKSKPWKEMEVKRVGTEPYKVVVAPMIYGVATKPSMFEEMVHNLFSSD